MSNNQGMELDLTPKKVFKTLALILTVLLSLNILGILSKLYFGHDHIFGLIPLFNFDTEKNIPTFYEAMLFFSISQLLLIITISHKKNNSSYLLWALLALIFLFLSIDEISSIHERLGKPTRNFFETSGLFYFAWIIPYGIALVVFVTLYLKFLFKLLPHIRVLFILSGFVFVLGAIGFEMLGGRESELHGSKTLLYAFFYTCEEYLEMLGLTIFSYTLLKYICIEFNGLKILVTNKPTY